MKRQFLMIPTVLTLMLLACDSSENNDSCGILTPVEFSPDEVMLTITQFNSETQMSQSVYECDEYSLYGNGAFIYVMGDCRYYAFSPDDNSDRRLWADIYTGTLSEADCQTLQEEMLVGRFENKCREFSAGSLKSSVFKYNEPANIHTKKSITSRTIGNHISDGNGWVYCDNMTCQPTGEDICFQDIFTNASKWRQHMFDHGIPLDSDLRGLLITELDSYYSGVDTNFDTILPEGLENYAVNRWECTTINEENGFKDFPRNTVVFPQEYQAWLKKARADFLEQNRQGNLDNFIDGIPVKDAEGQKYTLYVRPTIPELEDEIGRLPMPSLCADEDREYIHIIQ